MTYEPISVDEAKRSAVLLERGSHAFEQHLIEQGVPVERAQEWAFHIWEITTDLRDMQRDIAQIYNADVQQVPSLLREMAREILYGHITHLEYHMNTLDESLNAVLGSDADDE